MYIIKPHICVLKCNYNCCGTSAPVWLLFKTDFKVLCQIDTVFHKESSNGVLPIASSPSIILNTHIVSKSLEWLHTYICLIVRSCKPITLQHLVSKIKGVFGRCRLETLPPMSVCFKVLFITIVRSSLYIYNTLLPRTIPHWKIYAFRNLS